MESDVKFPGRLVFRSAVFFLLGVELNALFLPLTFCQILALPNRKVRAVDGAITFNCKTFLTIPLRQYYEVRKNLLVVNLLLTGASS